MELEIYLAVGGEARAESVDFTDLANFAVGLDDCVARLSRAIGLRSRSGVRPRFAIKSVRIASFSATLEPKDLIAAHCVELLPNVLESLRQGVIPDGMKFTGDDIRAFKKLADPLSSQTGTIRVGNIPIDFQYRDNVGKLLSSASQSLGEIVGRLDALNVHQKSTCIIYPESQSHGVKCYFQPELYETVHGLMRRRVRATGKLRRDPNGISIDSAEINKIERLPEDNELPDPLDLEGILSGGPSLEEIREGWHE